MSTSSSHFKKNLASTLALGSLLFAAVPAQAGDEPPCPADTRVAFVYGSLSNNVYAKPATDSPPVLETVGVARVAIQGKGILHCGLHGVSNSPGTFIDTLVCDDTVAVPNSTDTVHSQLITYTRFTVPPTQICASGGMQGAFKEISDPFFGRGMFSSGGGGRLHVQGTINCAGSIDMLFYGNVCLVK